MTKPKLITSSYLLLILSILISSCNSESKIGASNLPAQELLQVSISNLADIEWEEGDDETIMVSYFYTFQSPIYFYTSKTAYLDLTQQFLTFRSRAPPFI